MSVVSALLGLLLTSTISVMSEKQVVTARERDMSKEDAHKRAIEDYSQFSQYARTCAQFVFTANGGAAAAILSFLTAIIKPPAPVHEARTIVMGLAISASFYLAGAFFSLASMFSFYQSKQYWAHAWEDTAFTGYIDFDSRFSRGGYVWGRLGSITLVISALFFVVASFFAVWGFFRAGLAIGPSSAAT